MKTFFFTSALSIFATYCVFAFPSNSDSSCDVDWTVGLSCKDVAKKIVDQIEEWKGDDCAGSRRGARCLYTLKSSDESSLKAEHSRPTGHRVDITITFGAKGSGCSVTARGHSQDWYANALHGTNYCDLKDLITGSGLDKTPNYREVTENSRCPGYSSAECDAS